MPPKAAFFNIGPVSSFIVPGQTLSSREPIDGFYLPVRVGGPFESSVELGLVVYDGLQKTNVLARGQVNAVSGPADFDLVRFRLDRAAPPGTELYFEVAIPYESQWPVLLAGTRGDEAKAEGRLYLQGKPGWDDQDLAYQHFRRQSLASRLGILWHQRGGSLAVAAFSLVLVHGCVVGLVAVVKSRWKLTSIAPVAAAALSAALAAGYFVAFL